MNILFLTPRDSKTNLGGVERHVRLLTEELERRGHEVKELSLGETDKSYKDYKNYKDQNNTPIASLDSSTRRKLLARNDAFFKFRAWRYLWDRRELLRWAEVVHVHDVFWWVMPFLLIAKIAKISEKHEQKDKKDQKDKRGEGNTRRHLKRKIFVTFHGWEGRCPPTWVAVWQKRLAAFLSDGTIGVGSFFEKWYGVKTDRVVWGAIDQRIAKIAKISENRESVDSIILPTRQGRTLGTGNKIVFLGRLEEVNGIEVVIEAAKKLRELREFRDFGKPIFIGDGGWREEAEKVGRVTGMVGEPWKYLVGAEVVIASSYLAILEAAALGKRIIAIANNPLKRDYLEGHPLKGYFRVVKDVEGLIREIREIGEFYKGPTPMLHRGRTFAIGQTAGKLADEYEKLWRIRGEG